MNVTPSSCLSTFLFSPPDVDECKEDLDNQCTHFCHNYVGGYYCSCQHGYHLDEDEHTCTGTGQFVATCSMSETKRQKQN